MLRKPTQTRTDRKRSNSSSLIKRLRPHSGLALALMLTCIASSAMAQTVKMKTNSDGQARLRGQWQSIGVIRDEQYSDPGEATYYRFEQNHFKIQVPGKSETSIAYVASDGQIPMQLDATLGAEKARMIYGFDSERLWISHSKPGFDRPNSLLDDNDYGLSAVSYTHLTLPTKRIV